MKKLAIAIPTYNRSEKVDAQIRFLFEECNQIEAEVDLYVFDNCSTDDTGQILSQYNQRDNFKYQRNKENLGLVGNCLHIINSVNTEYVWLVGDDDKLYKGIVKQVFSSLTSQAGLIHLNHRCIDGRNGQTVHNKLYEGDLKKLSSQVLIDSLLSNRHAGGFMFITANVLKTRFAQDILRKSTDDEKRQLAYPMYLNLAIALKHGIKFLEDPLMDCIYYTSSWAKEAHIVNEIQVPQFLIKLKKLGLSKAVISKVISHQLSFKINPLKFPFWVSIFQWRAVYFFLRTR